MIAFATTTAFRLVRRLAMGRGSTAMYLLIYDEGTEGAIENDLQAEVEVQLQLSRASFSNARRKRPVGVP